MKIINKNNILAFISSLLLATSISNVYAAPGVIQSTAGLNASNLAVIVNDADPLSVQVGQLYASMRKIPIANLLHVYIAPGSTVMTPDAFKIMKDQLDLVTPKNIQGYLLTWNSPYRVGGMSITSAFTLGYDVKYTSPQLCAMTAVSPYYNHATRLPYTDLKIRPAMILGAKTIEGAKDLINRGISAYGTNPAGTSYLVSTSDSIRNERARTYNNYIGLVSPFIKTEINFTDALVGKLDVMFYFTGLARVASITTNKFLPGAVADHFTSYGGMLTNSPQMSALEWLQGGATGSYGSVVEPCNYTQKFPSPKIMMQHYLAGETLIESYWKSVYWPGEGVFVGEPLARPFTKTKIVKNLNGSYSLSFPWMAAGTYNVMVTESSGLPLRLYKKVAISSAGPLTINVSSYDFALYQIVRAGDYSVVDANKVYTTVPLDITSPII